MKDTLCIFCGPEGHPEGAAENEHRTWVRRSSGPPEYPVGAAVQLRTQLGVGHAVGAVLGHTIDCTGARVTAVRWREDCLDLHVEADLAATPALCDLPPLDCGRPDWFAQYRYRMAIYECASEAERERFCMAALTGPQQ